MKTRHKVENDGEGGRGMTKYFGAHCINVCLAVCFSKHESPFGPLAAWVRVNQYYSSGLVRAVEVG